MSRFVHSPRYIQIAAYLRNLIQRNQLKKGNQLPTEMELCRRFECSRTTVRQALDTLVRDGDIRRIRGAGTFVADQVVSANSMLLAVIVPNVTTSEISRMVHVIGMAAHDLGYTPLMGVTNDNPEIERQFLDKISTLNVTGVLKFPTTIELEEDVRARLREYGLPYVVINDFWMDSRQDYLVMYDECAAVAMAVDHLVKLGHRRIVLLDSVIGPRDRAIHAFFKALAKHGLPREESHLLLYHLDNPGPPIERLYVEGGPQPTAFVTVFDVIAAQLVVQLHKFEMRVPEDVSVVNINDKPIEMPMNIDLTTSVPPHRKMVDQALKVLSERLPESHVQHYVFKPEFYVGQSSGPCREAAELRRSGAVSAGASSAQAASPVVKGGEPDAR